MKNIHLHVDGVTTISNAKFEDITTYVTSLKTSIMQSIAGHTMLFDSKHHKVSVITLLWLCM